MSQGTYQNHSIGLVFLFSNMGLEIYEQFNIYVNPFVVVIKRTVVDEKVMVVGE